VTEEYGNRLIRGLASAQSAGKYVVAALATSEIAGSCRYPTTTSIIKSNTRAKISFIAFLITIPMTRPSIKGITIGISHAYSGGTKDAIVELGRNLDLRFFLLEIFKNEDIVKNTMVW
jgi:hypothetical protein